MTGKPKIRVAQIVTRMDVGGVPDHVMTLARNLRADYEITVICGALDPRHAIALCEMGVEVARLPFSRLPDPLQDVRATRALDLLIRERNFDIAHTHMSKATLLGVLATRLTGRRGVRPVVVNTAHNLGSLALSHAIMRLAFRVYDHLLLGRLTDAVIVVSERVRREVLRRRIVPPGQLVSIPNGIALARFNHDLDETGLAAHRAEFGAGPEDVLIVSVARLVWFKGLDVLIDSMALLAPRWPEARLAIVGAGPLRETLERRAEDRGITDRVVFAGERADVPEILAAADLFALSSVSEGMPISILEAMAASLPVVATDVGGVSELVEDGHTGTLIPPRDPKAFASALDRLVADQALRATMGAQGRARVEAEFTEEAMAARTAALYADLIAARANKAAV